MNIDEFRDNPDLFIKEILRIDTLDKVFAGGFDLVYHLAASINAGLD